MADLVAMWNGDSFRAELTAWLDVRLAPLGLARAGALVPARVRFWSAVFCAPVNGEDQHRRVWVKVGNPGQAFEGFLLRALAELVPAQVVAPLAVDAARGWWLLPDGGPTLGESGAREFGTVWPSLLEQVARLQRDVAPHRAELSVVPALPMGSVVDEVERRFVVLGALDPADPQHLTADALASARTGLPRLAASMDRLARLGIPETLQPNDIRPGNALRPLSPGAPFRLFDLGDAFWSHPFGVLHLPLRLAAGASLAGSLPPAPEVGHLAEAYLRCWPEVPESLWPDVLEAADRLGAVHRGLSWERLLAHVDPAALSDPPRVGTWLCHSVAP